MATQQDVLILSKAMEIDPERRAKIASLIIDLLDLGLMFIKNPILKQILKFALMLGKQRFGYTYMEFESKMLETKLEVEKTGVRRWL